MVSITFLSLFFFCWIFIGTRSARIDNWVRSGVGRTESEPPFVPYGSGSTGFDHPDMQRHSMPSSLEYERLFRVQPILRRRSADPRSALHPRGGPRWWEYAARRGGFVSPATTSRAAILQHDRLPGRMEDGRMEPGTSINRCSIHTAVQSETQVSRTTRRFQRRQRMTCTIDFRASRDIWKFW